MISIELLARYKEKMKIATEKGNIDEAKKYYKLLRDGYKELTGESLEDLLKNNKSSKENEIEQ